MEKKFVKVARHNIQAQVTEMVFRTFFYGHDSSEIFGKEKEYVSLRMAKEALSNEKSRLEDFCNYYKVSCQISIEDQSIYGTVNNKKYELYTWKVIN